MCKTSTVDETRTVDETTTVDAMTCVSRHVSCGSCSVCHLVLYSSCRVCLVMSRHASYVSRHVSCVAWHVMLHVWCESCHLFNVTCLFMSLMWHAKCVSHVMGVTSSFTCATSCDVSCVLCHVCGVCDVVSFMSPYLIPYLS